MMACSTRPARNDKQALCNTPASHALLIRLARSLACSFSLAWSRWALTVCVEHPISLDISSKFKPDALCAITSVSRRVSPAVCVAATCMVLALKSLFG